MLYARDFLTDQQVYRSVGAPASPEISIILPTYARRRCGYLERSINSVLAQSFGDFELIVMDDGSRDGTADLVQEFQRRDPRVIHVRHEFNSGLPGLRCNEGIELSRGQYIAFQFDDDVWRTEALEKLVEPLGQSDSAAVAIGKALVHSKNGDVIIPRTEVNTQTLVERNRFANNCVLIPRALLETYGMYDCHVGMRRLCDWDLWLRLARHVPFLVVDHVIADAYEGNAGAIGMTVPWDLPLFRFLHAVPRGELLRSGAWKDYPVDSLRINEVELPPALARRLYERQIVPFYLAHRHQFPQLEAFRATLTGRKRNVVYTCRHYDVTQDISFDQYDPHATRRGTYKTHFQVLDQFDPRSVGDYDALILARVMQPEGPALAQAALDAGRPVAYYLDDHLLAFHEFGEAFSYVAPGTPCYETMVRLMSAVDAVWTTNPFITESVAPYNPRIIPHLGCTPPERLPDSPPRRSDRPIRIGYAGTGYRIDEFKQLWPAFQAVSEEFGSGLEFEFWGLDISSLPPLSSPVKQVPFSTNYGEYLQRLRDAEFDLLVTPLLTAPQPRLGKSLIKYYETAVAGALGIFSDVPQYAPLPDNETCLKADNTVEAWCDALRRAITMLADEFDRMRAACIEHVRESYTSRAQTDRYEAALRATEFHSLTRGQRKEDGRPRVVYVLHSAWRAGAEIQQWRRMEMMRAYGVEPVMVLPAPCKALPEGIEIREEMERQGIETVFLPYRCFTEPYGPDQYSAPAELESITDFLKRVQPALVHTVTFIPSFGQACGRLGIPHVASLYQFEDDFVWRSTQANTYRHCQVNHCDSIRYMRRWSELLHSEGHCSREVAPERMFEAGRHRLRALQSEVERNQAPLKSRRVRIVLVGTIQPRKCQLEAVAALGRLRGEGYDVCLDLYGYTRFGGEYLDACQKQIEQDGTADCIQIKDFCSDILPAFSSADIYLSASNNESLATTVKEAMAAGVQVVVAPAGGLGELVIDGVTGIMCENSSVDAITEGLRRALEMSGTDRLAIVRQARKVAFEEFHPLRAVNDIFTMYVRAIEIARGNESRPLVEVPVSSSSNCAAPVPKFTMSRLHFPPLGHRRIRQRVRYILRPEQSNWRGIDVLIGTHQRQASGRLLLNVRNRSGRILRHTSVELKQARDNEWLPFRFQPIVNSHWTEFILEFVLEAPSRDTLVSVYEGTTTPSRLTRIRRRVLSRSPSPLTCQLLYGRQA